MEAPSPVHYLEGIYISRSFTRTRIRLMINHGILKRSCLVVCNIVALYWPYAGVLYRLGRIYLRLPIYSVTLIPSIPYDHIIVQILLSNNTLNSFYHRFQWRKKFLPPRQTLRN